MRCAAQCWRWVVSIISPHHDRVNWEMHSEAVIERVWTYTWRLWSSKFDDALGGRDRATLDAVIVQVQRYTRRLWWSEFGMHLEAMIERDWRRTWRRSIWSRQFGRESRLELRLYSLVNLWLSECRELSTTRYAERWQTGWERQDSRSWDDAGTRCMQYAVYTVLTVCCTWCMLYLVLTLDHDMER